MNIVPKSDFFFVCSHLEQIYVTGIQCGWVVILWRQHILEFYSGKLLFSFFLSLWLVVCISTGCCLLWHGLPDNPPVPLPRSPPVCSGHQTHMGDDWSADCRAFSWIQVKAQVFIHIWDVSMHPRPPAAVQEMSSVGHFLNLVCCWRCFGCPKASSTGYLCLDILLVWPREVVHGRTPWDPSRLHPANLHH